MDRTAETPWLLVMVVDNEVDAQRVRQAVAQASGGLAPLALLAPGAPEIARLEIPAAARQIYDRYLAAGHLLATARVGGALLPQVREAAEAAGAYGARVYAQRAVAPPSPAGDGAASRGLPASPLGDRRVPGGATEFRSGGEASRGEIAVA